MKEMMFQLGKDTNFNHSIFIYENNNKKSSSIIGVNINYEIRVFFLKSSINFEKNFKRFLFQ